MFSCDQQAGEEDKKEIGFGFRADGPGWIVPTQARRPLLQQERLERQRTTGEQHLRRRRVVQGDQYHHGQRRNREQGIDAREAGHRKPPPMRTPIRRQ